MPELLPRLPLRSRLIEPFVGAGSVFLAADYDDYLINDANPDLVAVWTELKLRPARFMEAASAYFIPHNDNAEAYYRIRSDFNACPDPFERAVRLPYLNRFGFNGLYRVNHKGQFNVPFGKRTSLPLFPREEMTAAAAKLQRCTVTLGDFEAILQAAGFGDAVYCDPPYLDSSTGGSFTGYTRDGFTLEDQRRLVQHAREAVNRGATVLISNHDTPLARCLYRGFDIHTVSVRRSLSANLGSRRAAREFIAVLRPRPGRIG